MVDTGNHIRYLKIYLLIKQALLLPVATSSFERAFSSMTYVKNKFRNRLGDEMLNDCLIVYIEKDVDRSLDKKIIIQYFENIKTRRGEL